MGASAGHAAAKILRDALFLSGSARIIVASAPSQDETLSRLAQEPRIDWSKVTVFHMDEYVGLSDSHPASFRAYQKEHFLSKVTPKAFHGIQAEAADLDSEVARYTELMNESPIDLVCMGIGENGHIAFNDPPVADFNDPHTIKVVELDEACRQQQVNDGCFPDFDSVPTHALSLTCPALMSGKHLIITVPGKLKANAVKETLTGPITTTCPASILRTHPNAELHLDTDSYQLVGA
ncbi:MAG: glucosamine-6-phosphate deaminase [Verrucomicrobiaceae bacterium TMED86]|nr:MAG: glucosamine-6-phosphate deaminase [Verrucomicrobiaceae bacterium TMED86]